MNYIIKKYVNKLTKDDMINFLKQNNIYLSENESNLLFDYAKNNVDKILYQNPLNDIKDKLNPPNFEKIKKLYIFYKEKYHNYL